jgi:hypothetical protein
VLLYILILLEKLSKFSPWLLDLEQVLNYKKGSRVLKSQERENDRMEPPTNPKST